MISSHQYAKTSTTAFQKWRRQEIQKRCHFQVPKEYKEKYIDILYKHQDALSEDKYDLVLAKDFTHKIHLK